MSILKVLLALVLIALTHVSFGQKTSVASGAWTTASNWSPSGAPSVNDVVIVNHAMTLPANTYTSWNGTSSITINNGGSISVTGNLILTGSGMRYIINAGGALNVSGAFTVDNQPSVTMNGGQLNAGNLSVGSAVTFTVAAGASLTATSLTTTSNNNALFNNLGTSTINGNVTSSGVITNSGTMQVNGNFTQANTGNSTTNSGNLYITGDAAANGLIRLNPGASTNSNMIVAGTLTVNANPWIIVGTNISACNSVITRYANLVVVSNLILTGSGDVTVNQTGRLAVFGDITRPSGGGSLITINCGGQVYVHGDIDLGTGGGNTVSNSNGAGSPTGSDGSPIMGLYVNGTVTAQVVTGTIGDQDNLISNNSDFFNWIASQPSSPLAVMPVKLISFSAHFENNVVVLNWNTSREEGFSHFEVERAGENLKFQEIARVNGAGYTTEDVQKYAYTDITPIAGNNYYRLKAVDIDGSFEYFKIALVTTSSKQAFSVFPNPAKENFVNYSLNFDYSDNDRIVVLDNMGNVLQQTSISSIEGKLVFGETTKPGLYFIQYVSDNFKQTIRVVIR